MIKKDDNKEVQLSWKSNSNIKKGNKMSQIMNNIQEKGKFNLKKNKKKHDIRP